MSIGARIKQQRERHGWTLRELARNAHVDAGWIHRLESGQRHNISLEAAKRVALVLGVSLDYLACIVDRPTARRVHDDDSQPCEACHEGESLLAAAELVAP